MHYCLITAASKDLGKCGMDRVMNESSRDILSQSLCNQLSREIRNFSINFNSTTQNNRQITGHIIAALSSPLSKKIKDNVMKQIMDR